MTRKAIQSRAVGIQRSLGAFGLAAMLFAGSALLPVPARAEAADAVGPVIGAAHVPDERARGAFDDT